MPFYVYILRTSKDILEERVGEEMEFWARIAEIGTTTLQNKASSHSELTKHIPGSILLISSRFREIDLLKFELIF